MKTLRSFNLLRAPRAGVSSLRTDPRAPALPCTTRHRCITLRSARSAAVSSKRTAGVGLGAAGA